MRIVVSSPPPKDVALTLRQRGWIESSDQTYWSLEATERFNARSTLKLLIELNKKGIQCSLL